METESEDSLFPNLEINFRWWNYRCATEDSEADEAGILAPWIDFLGASFPLLGHWRYMRDLNWSETHESLSKAASWRNQGLLKTLESPIGTNSHPFPWDYGRSRPVMWRLSNKKSKSPLLESKEASFYEKNCMGLEIPEKCAFLRIRRTRIFVGVAGDGKERSEEFWASYPLIPHRTSPFGLTTRRHVLLIRFIDRYFEIQFTETIVGSEPEIGSE